nr:hypothetical protein GCM10020093_059890 [Planobispora longispora]
MFGGKSASISGGTSGGVWTAPPGPVAREPGPPAVREPCRRAPAAPESAEPAELAEPAQARYRSSASAASIAISSARLRWRARDSSVCSHSTISRVGRWWSSTFRHGRRNMREEAMA